MPRRDAATPLTADETIWVIGEVVLIERSVAILIAKPRVPVINDPQANVVKSPEVSPVKISIIAGISPAKIETGSITQAPMKLLYHDNSSALPPTALRLFLMTIECEAVIAELTTPKEIPVREIGVPSMKTPMKKPRVTMKEERRMRAEGRWERKM
jgi:hypothetical protein